MIYIEEDIYIIIMYIVIIWIIHIEIMKIDIELGVEDLKAHDYLELSSSSEFSDSLTPYSNYYYCVNIYIHIIKIVHQYHLNH